MGEGVCPSNRTLHLDSYIFVYECLRFIQNVFSIKKNERTTPPPHPFLSFKNKETLAFQFVLNAEFFNVWHFIIQAG